MPKYCETLKQGYYLIKGIGARCIYVTGTTKGNKWINLEVPNPQWTRLQWNCIHRDEIEIGLYSETNPTSFSDNDLVVI